MLLCLLGLVVSGPVAVWLLGPAVCLLGPVAVCGPVVCGPVVPGPGGGVATGTGLCGITDCALCSLHCYRVFVLL